MRFLFETAPAGAQPAAPIVLITVVVDDFGTVQTVFDHGLDAAVAFIRPLDLPGRA